MTSPRSMWLLAALALAACTNPVDETRSTCEQLQARSCAVGCESRSDCTELWLAASELDPADVVETCIGACPRETCASDTFFECGCYARCMRQGSSELQEAILAASRCDLEGVPTECAGM